MTPQAKQPVFILLVILTTAFFFASLLYAATVSDVMQAIAQEKVQVDEAVAYTHTVSTFELACVTDYWGHNMIDAHYANGVWYYSCHTTAGGATWEGDGVLATNVYYYGQMPDLYN